MPTNKKKTTLFAYKKNGEQLSNQQKQKFNKASDDTLCKFITVGGPRVH
jgi:hypothetical protein